MGSRRLPGKVLRPFAGTTILGLLIERMRAFRSELGEVHVATTGLAEDDAVAGAAAERGCRVYRGSPENVLSRFTGIIRQEHPTFIVRATADDPFMDGAVGARLIDIVRTEGVDHAFAVDLPKGVSPEIARADALLRLEAEDPDPDEAEHVTLGLKRRPAFRVLLVSDPLGAHLPPLDLSIDTAAQFEAMSRLAAQVLPRFGALVPVEEVVRAWRDTARPTGSRVVPT